jgi:hypothetical protein
LSMGFDASFQGMGFASGAKTNMILSRVWEKCHEANGPGGQ